jgi:hypothetical protein
MAIYCRSCGGRNFSEEDAREVAIVAEREAIAAFLVFHADCAADSENDHDSATIYLRQCAAKVRAGSYPVAKARG